MSDNRSKLPFYELDRMILSSFGRRGVLMARDIIERVEKDCRDRGVSISREELMDRIGEMVDVGSLTPIGPLAKWRYRELYPALFDY